MVWNNCGFSCRCNPKKSISNWWSLTWLKPVWPIKGWKISARAQLCVRARAQPAPHGPGHRHPRAGADSKVLLRAHLLVTASEKPDCRFKLGNRVRKAANCKPREKGSASWLCGPFWAKCPSCDRLWRWVSGPLAPCTPHEPHIASLAFALQFHPSGSFTAARKKTSVQRWLKQQGLV